MVARGVNVKLKRKHSPNPIPQPSVADRAHTGLKAALSLIPIVGGTVAEVIAATFTPPLTKRRDEWLISLSDGLASLERQVEGMKAEELVQNDAFVTTAMHASQIALRNHQKEKLEALRNVVLNSALPGAPEDDKQHMFVNFIDTMASWHLRILKFCDDPTLFGANPDDYPLRKVLKHTFAELDGQAEFLDQILRDLDSRGLLLVESLHQTIVSPQNSAEVTALGKEFLSFLSSPLE